MSALLAQLSDALVSLVARVSPSVVGVARKGGQGTGFFLSPDGQVLTNEHVVRGASEITVHLAGGNTLPARVVGTDPTTDLALLSVEGRDLPRLPLADSRKAAVGQLVVAIGNPFQLDRSVSLGVVSALDRQLGGRRGPRLDGLLQTDAAINPGNSGGPLVDAHGAVLGVNTAIIPFAQGIGFAVPAHTASWVAAVLAQHGVVKRPRLGIQARSVAIDAEAHGLGRGVEVQGVKAGSPADRAGIRGGDVLLTADGAPLRSIDELQRVLIYAQSRPVRLELARSGRRETVEVAAQAA